MRANEVMSEIGVYSPNSIDESLKYKWLSTAELHAREVLNSYEGHNYVMRMLSPDTDGDEELVVPEPYSELYKHYILAQINLMYGDTAKYNVYAQLYGDAFGEFCLWCVRTYRSKNTTVTVGVI